MKKLMVIVFAVCVVLGLTGQTQAMDDQYYQHQRWADEQKHWLDQKNYEWEQQRIERDRQEQIRQDRYQREIDRTRDGKYPY